MTKHPQTIEELRSTVMNYFKENSYATPQMCAAKIGCTVEAAKNAMNYFRSRDQLRYLKNDIYISMDFQLDKSLLKDRLKLIRRIGNLRRARILYGDDASEEGRPEEESRRYFDGTEEGLKSFLESRRRFMSDED